MKVNKGEHMFCMGENYFYHVFCPHTEKHVFSLIYFYTNSPNKIPQIERSRSVFVYFRQLLYCIGCEVINIKDILLFLFIFCARRRDFLRICLQAK